MEYAFYNTDRAWKLLYCYVQQSKSKTKKKGKSHKILKFLSKTCFSLGTLDDALEVYGNVAVAWSRLSIKPRFDVNVVHMLSAHRQEAM